MESLLGPTGTLELDTQFKGADGQNGIGGNIGVDMSALAQVVYGGGGEMPAQSGTVASPAGMSSDLSAMVASNMAAQSAAANTPKR